MLPIDSVLDDLKAILARGRNAVLVAPPGAGKTTRVPLALLDAEWLTGKIVMLEPRRLAARASARRMAEMLGELRNSYDFIIIDGPPVLLISDPKMLAKCVDATVVVVNATATHRGAALRMIRELEEVDANVVGCVLMAAPSLKGGYFQEQYKSYRRYQEKLQVAGA